MQSWSCTICRYVFDPAEGDPVNEVPAGVSFEELLDGWNCPICGAGKSFFEPLA